MAEGGAGGAIFRDRCQQLGEGLRRIGVPKYSCSLAPAAIVPVQQQLQPIPQQHQPLQDLGA